MHPGHEERRVIFYQWFLQQIHVDPNLDKGFISSEGVFNRHNAHHWSDVNPHQNCGQNSTGAVWFPCWVALFHNRALAYEMYNENFNAQEYVRILQENIIEPLDYRPAGLSLS